MVRYSADLRLFDNHVSNQPANWDLYLEAIAFKAGGTISHATLVETSPNTSVTNWDVSDTGWMNGAGGVGCDSGNVNNACADVSALGQAVLTTGNSYWWDFVLTQDAAAIATGQPIRAEFLNAAGGHSGLLSETTPTSVPEPTSLLLLGTGLLGAGFFGRRRRK